MAKGINKLMIFAISAFALLGVLFGMQIVAYMSGNLGVASEAAIADSTVTITNLTDAYFNATVYTIPEANDRNFTSFSITAAYNTTNVTFNGGPLIPSGNYTVNSAAGTVTNATALNWGNVTLTYVVTVKSDAKIALENIDNSSLQAINNYSNQSGTQMTTIAISITLVILILIFMIFWNFFMKGKMGGSDKSPSAGSFR